MQTKQWGKILSYNNCGLYEFAQVLTVPNATTITFEFLEEPLSRGKVELTVPVYRCQGSGVVKVKLTVAPDGSVREARVLEPIIGSDRICFADAALSAARSSQFRIELSGPVKHFAIITYSFIAQ